jgi:HAD superfamily hydrolase (TIGR01509 family)
MFEAIILDLDGLLVDSEACQLEAWNQYLKPFGVELDPSEAARLVDQRDYDNAELLRRRFNLPIDPLTMAEERNEILLRLAEEQIEPRPGALELVQMLRDNGMRLALICAGVREYIYVVTDKLGWEEAFDVIVAGDMIELSKPNPMPFLACAETFALHPSACLVIEDSRLGVEAAINAGMKVICVPGPSTERWRITGADLVLNNLDYINMQTFRSLWIDSSPELRPQPMLQPERRRRVRW